MIRAIAFDVQGTCVDFYQPILRAGQAVNAAKGLALDWAKLSSEWRDLYRAALDDVIAGSHKVPGAIWSLGKTLVDNAVRKSA